MKKKHIAGAVLLATVLTNVTGQAGAVGKHPAFQDTQNKSTEEIYNLVLEKVKGRLQEMIPQAAAYFPESELYKSLQTNYKDISYPSINDGNNEGINSDNVIDMYSLKKPIQEPSRIALAELVRYYNFNFSSSMNFVTISRGGANYVSDQNYKSANEKLNYFDYITLIQAVKSNPSYSKTERDQRLIDIEKDLDNSIHTLYGWGTSTVLPAWGEAKSVQVPFNHNKFSYLQLLAAYEKDEAIFDTLSYYSTIIDTLSTIKEFSISIRQDRNFNLDVTDLATKLHKSYEKVNKTLITPVTDIVRRNENDEDRAKQAKEQEKAMLAEMGLSKG